MATFMHLRVDPPRGAGGNLDLRDVHAIRLHFSRNAPSHEGDPWWRRGTLDIILVHVVPPPRFSEFQGLDDRVVSGMKVRGGVPQR